MNFLSRLALLASLLFVPLVSADALMRSQAMFANTIAEIFVDASGVAAEQITATPLPDGITAEPFSFELLFSGED